MLVDIDDRSGGLYEVEHVAFEVPAQFARGLVVRRLCPVPGLLAGFVEVAHDLEHGAWTGLRLGAESAGEGCDGIGVRYKPLKDARDLLVYGESRIPAFHDPTVCNGDGRGLAAAAAADRGSVGCDPENFVISVAEVEWLERAK